MRQILICSAILFSAFCPATARADDPVSGPKVGEVVKGFEVEVATGEEAGKTLDLLQPLKDKIDEFLGPSPVAFPQGG